MGNPIDLEKAQEHEAHKLRKLTTYEKLESIPNLKSRCFNLLLLSYIFVSLLLLTISSVSKPMKWNFILKFDFSKTRFKMQHRSSYEWFDDEDFKKRYRSSYDDEPEPYIYLIPTNDTSSDSYSRESLNIYGVYQMGLWNWLKWDVSEDGGIDNFTIGPQKSSSTALNLEEVINNDLMKVNSSFRIELPDLQENLGYWGDSTNDMKPSYEVTKVIQPFFVLTLLFFSVTFGLTIHNYIQGNKKALRRFSAVVTFVFVLFTTAFYSLASPGYSRLLLMSFDYISVSYSKSAAGLFYLFFIIYFFVFIKMMFRG